MKKNEAPSKSAPVQVLSAADLAAVTGGACRRGCGSGRYAR